MMRGMLAFAAPAALLFAAALSLSSFGSSTAAQSNVLLLVADDLRPEVGSFGGGAITPYLDQLAKSSLVLKNNYVQQAVCGPTRASFMTGRRPNTLRTVTHAVKNTYWRRLSGNYSSMPEAFKEAGWYTLSFGKTFDLRTSSFNLSSEFICDGIYSWSEPPLYCGTTQWDKDHEMGGGHSHAVLSVAEEANSSDVTISNAAIARLNGTLPQPWFVAVGLHRPHLPFIVPQRMLDLYPHGASPTPVMAPPINMPAASTECSGGKVCMPGHGSFELWEQYTFNVTQPAWNGWDGLLTDALPDDRAAELRRFYFAAVSHTDEIMGNVIAAVARRVASKLDAAPPVIAVIGDHGWHLGDQGVWGKCTNFEAATRAPLMMHVPGVTDRTAGGVVTTSLTEHVDLLPTLAEAAGLGTLPTCTPATPASIMCTEGVSVLPLAADPTAVVKKASFSQWPIPFASQTPPTMGYTMRTPTARYTEWVAMDYGKGPDGAFIPQWNTVCGRELYIYSAASATTAGAPHTSTAAVTERANVANDPEHAEMVAVLSKQLHAGWRVAAGGAPWPTDLPSVNQTFIPTCPGGAVAPAPPPPTPCMQPTTLQLGYARTCTNATAQANRDDASCWCNPANMPVQKRKMASYTDCETKCKSDPACFSWTFSATGGCFRHSTARTYTHPTGEKQKVWSSCIR
jgi:iduronate 2-sulfatase